MMFKKKSDKNPTVKTCPNGHVQDPTWTQCLACASAARAGTARASELKRTVFAGDTEKRGGDAGTKKTVVLHEARKPPVVGWLVALDGPHKGEDFRLREGQTLVGSGPDSQICLDDDGISARHASIRHHDGGTFTLTDLDSTNGTEVNGQTASKVPLVDGDLVRFGSTTLVFKSL